MKQDLTEKVIMNVKFYMNIVGIQQYRMIILYYNIISFGKKVQGHVSKTGKVLYWTKKIAFV